MPVAALAVPGAARTTPLTKPASQGSIQLGPRVDTVAWQTTSPVPSVTAPTAPLIASLVPKGADLVLTFSETHELEHLVPPAIMVRTSRSGAPQSACV